MTIKALHGGKLLCLMAAVAGAMTLGSCKDDDDDNDSKPEPEPVQKDTTPKKVTFPDEYLFRLKDTRDSLKSGDTIKANTLLNNGVNSDTISVDVILRNNVKVNTASLTLSNDYLKDVKFEGESTDSIYSVTFPAIEGKYSLKINGKTRNFVVAGTGKELSKTSRSLSNKYSVTLDADNKSILGIEFAAKEKVTIAHIKSSTGKIINFTDEKYNEYISKTPSEINDEIEKDIKNAEDLLPLEGLNAFEYIDADGKAYICKVVKSEGGNSTEVTIEIAY